jgi:hypothetical protein
MRSFTEYAGPRPSTLASTVADVPAANRFNRTNGVLPILAALSAKKFAMSSPLN